jgi:hypothetical protein
MYDTQEEIKPNFWSISDPYHGELKYYEQCIYFDSFGYVLTFIWLAK